MPLRGKTGKDDLADTGDNGRRDEAKVRGAPLPGETFKVLPRELGPSMQEPRAKGVQKKGKKGHRRNGPIPTIKIGGWFVKL